MSKPILQTISKDLLTLSDSAIDLAILVAIQQIYSTGKAESLDDDIRYCISSQYYIEKFKENCPDYITKHTETSQRRDQLVKAIAENSQDSEKLEFELNHDPEQIGLKDKEIFDKRCENLTSNCYEFLSSGKGGRGSQVLSSRYQEVIDILTEIYKLPKVAQEWYEGQKKELIFTVSALSCKLQASSEKYSPKSNEFIIATWISEKLVDLNIKHQEKFREIIEQLISHDKDFQSVDKARGIEEMRHSLEMITRSTIKANQEQNKLIKMAEAALEEFELSNTIYAATKQKPQRKTWDAPKEIKLVEVHPPGKEISLRQEPQALKTKELDPPDLP